jgi:hypothetical protein
VGNSGSENDEKVIPQVSSVIPKKSCLVAAVIGNNAPEDPFESQKSFHYSDEEVVGQEAGDNTTSNVSPS